MIRNQKFIVSSKHPRPRRYKIFFSRRPGVNRSTPSGNDSLKWVPTTSTLIYGQKDAVLVGTQLTTVAGKELADWVISSGKNLTVIYIIHAHGDHFYGNAALLEHFPDAKVVSTPEVVARMAMEISPERAEGLWKKLFPGQIPEVLVAAVGLDKDEFELEGEKLRIVPSIRLAVTRDAVYNNTHPYLGESGSKQARLEWIAALNKIAALKPEIVVGGHSDPSRGFSPHSIEETKVYLEEFDRLNEQTATAEE
ncbi:metallo-beta-lactamase domain protein [Zopfia rhizophila CBS 207.26]|uniref:Metallo-beta-lactamase domain protein n=1 Tax=Zopfia rhizophila CBS 207.26 TaxID=1314779 RepID=A0A6A6ET08_9PEZI|nr:metallo-beta-lactamase domain protein [Zopfia rhizophila CBS 207.26]